MPRKGRRLLLLAYGVKVRTSAVMEGCHFGDSDIEIGRDSFINIGCVFDNSASIEIGERVQVGMEVMFVTSSHVLGTSQRRGTEVIAAPIMIGDGCWIGSRVTILPGVTVGPGCVIGAGALVREDCEPDGLYAGVPARRVKSLD
jgi:maltose O-acetyltransferase